MSAFGSAPTRFIFIALPFAAFATGVLPALGVFAGLFNANVTASGCRKMAYPWPRERYFTELSICPRLGSKLRGIWPKCSSSLGLEEVGRPLAGTDWG